MLELTYVGSSVTVAPNENVPFNSVMKCGCAEKYRKGSSQITLTKPGRYVVSASANVAVVNTGAIASLAITVDGEPINGAIMTSTPSAVAEFNNVASQIYVDVYPCCCSTVSLRSVGANNITVNNQNLSVKRIGGVC